MMFGVSNTELKRKVPTSDLEIVTEANHENHGKDKDKMIKSGKK